MSNHDALLNSLTVRTNIKINLARHQVFLKMEIVMTCCRDTEHTSCVFYFGGCKLIITHSEIRLIL